MDIASRGAGATKLSSMQQRPRLANVVDVEPTMVEEIDALAISSGFMQAGVLSVSADATASGSTSEPAPSPPSKK